MNDDRLTLFEFAGGVQAMVALATAHHGRCLADPVLNHPFTHGGISPDHVLRLAAYWAEVLGGPTTYSCRFNDQTGTLPMHAGNGDMSDLGGCFIECFVAAMDDARLPAHRRYRSAMHAYIRWAVDDFLSFAEPEDVGNGLATPRWGWGGLVTPG